MKNYVEPTATNSGLVGTKAVKLFPNFFLGAGERKKILKKIFSRPTFIFQDQPLIKAFQILFIKVKKEVFIELTKVKALFCD